VITAAPETFEHGGVKLAYLRQGGRAPTFVWLGGFKSDMTGTKANALSDWAESQGQAFLRFDYSGHGQSGGRFEDAVISDWADQAVAVIDQLTSGPLVLVGSSMGGWLALLAARARPERVAGLLLIAPAADFTEQLMWASFPDEVRRRIETQGRWERPSAYDPEPYVITKRLIEDGRRHLLMDKPYRFAGPVRILQGGEDPDVPEAHARALAALMQSPDLRFHLIADGDHRLSRAADIETLKVLAGELAGLVSA
jgi:pimeloyl-ACP methyl ester carboxylesterase